ncbi:hypothetical protein ABC337_04900 [Arthrobacter sp. 1P04PC]|uniref:hypothetical protein n=1 Tax=unclassified Arthrobacter TaxID=235627 RepID=UPI0039A216A8
MGNFSKVYTLSFSDDDSRGFNLTLGELREFVEHAKAHGAEDADPIFPELEREVDVVGMSIHINPNVP